jgi:hypothetical protein
MSSGQASNGYNPVQGYQTSGVPSQPAEVIRPNSFPGGPGPQATPDGGNPFGVVPSAAPAYGPIYQPGQQPARGGAIPASYLGQPHLPGGTVPGRQVAPAKLCSGSQMLARVGNDVILTCDVLITGVEDMMPQIKAQTPPEKVAEQRAGLVKEVTEAIEEFNAHYNDPDPAKGMSLAHQTLIYSLLQRQIEVKLLYQDFLKTVPKENWPTIQESVNKQFDEGQLKVLMKRENVVSRADLENSLQAKGSSLDRERRSFQEKVIAQEWMRQQVKKDDEKGHEEEVTHEEMRAWYQAHIKDFEQPAKVRWEELMIAFSRHASHDEAYAAIAALGNRVLAGASLADVAKSASDGPTARQGGQQDWTRQGSLSSEALDQAIFSLPVGQLSQILESDRGYHIIRVAERKEMTCTSFLDAQKKIKESIKQDRLDKRLKDFVKKLRAKYPVWTVFDNSLQKPKQAEEEDR